MPTKRSSVAAAAAGKADIAAFHAAVAISSKLVQQTLARRPKPGAVKAASAKVLKAATAKTAPPINPAFVKAAGTRPLGTLVAEGDSWFDYFWFDILNKLDDMGYEIEEVASAGDRVEDMAYSGGQLDALRRLLDKLIRRNSPPVAILLSGGGNDVAGDLAVLLNHAGSASPGPNDDVVRGVIDVRLRDAYLTILLSITELCVKLTGQAIPIILHGYARPRPDGKGVLGGAGPLPGPWLRPAFNYKGFADEQANTIVIGALIDRFNDMLGRITLLPAFKHVSYVDLRPVLDNSAAAYKTWWGNELHPTDKGFSAVAKKIAERI